MLEPSGKQEVYDGIFFSKGQAFNQGSTYVFEEDAYIDSCEKAVERYKSSPVNESGLKLQEKFTYKKTVDKILELIEQA